MNPAHFWVLVLGLVLTLSPCIASAQEDNSLDPVVANITEPWTGDLPGMLERRVIRVLVVPGKTTYFFDGGQPRGLNYDALVRFEEYLNEQLKTGHLTCHVLILPVDRNELIPSLVDGAGDIAVANLTITPDRSELVDFSNPVMTDVEEWLVTNHNHAPIRSLGDLAGLRVYVRGSSSYFTSLVAVNQRLAAAKMRLIHLEPADEHLEDEDLLEMVNAGLIPAVVVDAHKARFWNQILPDLKLHSDFPLSEGGNIGWAFRKHSPKLERLVNAFLKKHRKGTLFGNILFKRYLKNTGYIVNALAGEEMAKFDATADLFRKYAARYDFEWLLLVAQAYQESRLDNSLVSPAGAMGVMQLLPSTAADRHIQIDNIEDLENNIHAGTKYLRFIRDRYFDDPQIDAVDKMLFSFAAYNAGPAKVRALREEAASAGLDHNRWFDNVERVAAKRIGRETVQYVSNIYKYWLAYELALKAPAETETPTPE